MNAGGASDFVGDLDIDAIDRLPLGGLAAKLVVL